MSESDYFNYGAGGLALETAQPKLQRPSMYAVVMQNDDYTPMDFVVEILQLFFAKSLEQATQIMLTVHTKGSAVCAIYTKDVAETKMLMVNQYSEESEHPLKCDIVPIEEEN